MESALMQDDIIERVSRIPGVEAAAFADGVPMAPDRRNGIPSHVRGVRFHRVWGSADRELKSPPAGPPW